MDVKLIAYTEDAEQICGAIARSCYSHNPSDTLLNDGKDYTNVLRNAMASGHLSVIEHALYTFSIEGVSRVTTHQLVRHRMASYAQSSQRYVTAKGESIPGTTYVIPPTIHANAQAMCEYADTSKTCIETYHKLREMGIPDEDARYVLPGGMSTNITVSMNARELLHFFSLRCCCFDEKTEVLTTEGWKLFKDLRGDEVFYSLNPETWNAEFVKAEGYFKYDHYGDMIRIKTQYVDQLVTPNHKLYVCNSYENRNDAKWWGLIYAEDCLKKTGKLLMKNDVNPIKGIKTKYIVHNGARTTGDTPYCGPKCALDKQNIKTKDWFRLLGFYFSNGFLCTEGKIKFVGFYVRESSIVEKYAKILSKIGINKLKLFKNSTYYRMEVYDSFLFAHYHLLIEDGAKVIPEYVWDYDYTILECFYEGFCDGKINVKESPKETMSKRMAGDLQRMMLHIGKTSSIKDLFSPLHRNKNEKFGYVLSVNSTKDTPVILSEINNAMSVEQYYGGIYCVELERNNILYVRRNGIASWSGNSRAQHEIRELANQMLKLCKEVSPIIFENAGAPCLRGECPEGAFSCKKNQGGDKKGC